MSKRKTSRHKQVGMGARRRPAIVTAVAVVLSMFAACAMLAYSGAFSSAFRQKGAKRGTVSTSSFSSPSKEYGNSVTIADPASKSRKTVSDALGRVTSVVEDPGSAPADVCGIRCFFDGQQFRFCSTGFAMNSAHRGLLPELPVVSIKHQSSAWREFPSSAIDPILE